MTETLKRVTGYNSDHSTFGGIIYPSDFDTSYTNGNIAQRIENDNRFDKQCRKIQNRKKRFGGKKND